MVTANTKDQLMRDTVTILWASGQTGVKNVAFSLDIPENYAMEIHSVDFVHSSGVNPVTNRLKMYLVDDPDEIADPGHAAEKVIQSDELLVDTDAQTIRTARSKDCHRTLVVKNPNFVAVLDINPAANFNAYARIWFDFVKVSPTEVVDLMRQMTY